MAAVIYSAFRILRDIYPWIYNVIIVVGVIAVIYISLHG